MLDYRKESVRETHTHQMEGDRETDKKGPITSLSTALVLPLTLPFAFDSVARLTKRSYRSETGTTKKKN